MGFVDLHSHVLPGLDDGSPDLDTSVRLLGVLGELGFDQVFATPHQKASQFLPSREAIDGAYATTRDAIASAGETLTLGLGAENYWDHVFFERCQAGTVPSYDGGPAFLVEITPEETPARFEETLFQLRAKGRVPVLAHPERYVLAKDTTRLERLTSQCALVIDLAALAGHHGFFVGRTARRLVSEGLAVAAATDVHSLSDGRLAAEGIAWIKKKLGPDAVTRLLSTNPRRILGGELPEPGA